MIKSILKMILFSIIFTIVTNIDLTITIEINNLFINFCTLMISIFAIFFSIYSFKRNTMNDFRIEHGKLLKEFVTDDKLKDLVLDSTTSKLDRKAKKYEHIHIVTMINHLSILTNEVKGLYKPGKYIDKKIELGIFFLNPIVKRTWYDLISPSYSKEFRLFIAECIDLAEGSNKAIKFENYFDE